MSDWNTGIIAEFRKNHGKVGGNFEGAPLLLINHTGARTGKPRTNPVMYLKDATATWSSLRREEPTPIPTGTTTSRHIRTSRSRSGTRRLTYARRKLPVPNETDS